MSFLDVVIYLLLLLPPSHIGGTTTSRLLSITMPRPMQRPCKRFLAGVVVVLFLGVVNGDAVEGDEVYLWPMPKNVSHGSRVLCLSRNFDMTTQGSAYLDGSGLLKEGFQRMLEVVRMSHVVDGDVDADGPDVLHGLHVVVLSNDYELNFGTDESYELLIPAGGGKSYARIQANTVFGALHGLQTFSQICYVNVTSHVVQLQHAPWTISDEPRFPYRGLLIDTSRHYQSLPMIKKVIDAMAYTKLNVLHWHIADAQSFPLEIPSYPKLWNGAYSYSERYSMDDAVEIVQYAFKRGINVMPEIDVPGHARSWGVGYPSLWPAVDCQEPLDVSNKFTFKVIDGILSDFSKAFKFKFVHLGGDEVNTSCWATTPHISKWLKHKKLNESMAYKYFVRQVQKIATSHGFEVVNWEEPFVIFGNEFSHKTVVQNWLRSGVAKQAVAAGLRSIVSNQDKWYLDHLNANWYGFYMNEPLANITDPKQQKLVIGGEVCMWGETVDASDIEQTIWPRAAAAAERMWSPLSKLAKDPEQVTGRLANFRCLLNLRGIAATPLMGLGRTAPLEPGSCYVQ